MRPTPYLLLMVVLLAACQGLAPKPPAAETTTHALATADLKAEYRTLAAAGVVYAMNPVESDVRIYVFRGGKAAKLGHNHVLSVPNFEGYAYLPSDQPSEARFDLRVPLESLIVDEPRLRAETGETFSGERAASDIEGTRRNMLGPRGLDAAQFPFMDFKSVTIAGDWPILVAEMDITLHGVTRRQAVFLHVMHGRRGIIIRGSLVLHQTDFGITPYSLFGSLVAVQDAVVAEFTLGGDQADL